MDIRQRNPIGEQDARVAVAQTVQRELERELCGLQDAQHGAAYVRLRKAI